MHRTVKPSTLKLLASLSKQLEVSQGKVIDWAIEAAAVAESFGPQVLRKLSEQKDDRR